MTNSSTYEVLSPWSEIDPVPFRGIKPRIADLAHKKIGLFIDSKRAATPILKIVEEKIRANFPTAEFTYFASSVINEPVYETAKKSQFEDWLKGVDAVVAAVGD